MDIIIYMELNNDDVYIEYEGKNPAYVSYSKAKTLLKNTNTPIRYTASGGQRGCDFINSISNKRFTVDKNLITPKTSIRDHQK